MFTKDSDFQAVLNINWPFFEIQLINIINSRISENDIISKKFV